MSDEEPMTQPTAAEAMHHLATLRKLFLKAQSNLEERESKVKEARRTCDVIKDRIMRAIDQAAERTLFDEGIDVTDKDVREIEERLAEESVPQPTKTKKRKPAKPPVEDVLDGDPSDAEVADAEDATVGVYDPAEDDDAWAEEPITVLKLKSKLEKALINHVGPTGKEPIDTLGKLADLMADPLAIENLSGIGRTAAKEIKDAVYGYVNTDAAA